MKITSRDMQKNDSLKNGVCNEMVLIRFDINRYIENSICYVAFKLGYDLILWKPWMKKMVFNTILNPNVYGFDYRKWRSKTRFKENK